MSFPGDSGMGGTEATGSARVPRLLVSGWRLAGSQQTTPWYA